MAVPESTRIRWTGLHELQAWMRHLPAQLVGEATEIIDDAVAAARSDIYSAYPVVTGNLRAGLQVNRMDEDESGYLTKRHLGYGALLYNNAKHAYIFEHGTQARHYSGTDKLGREYHNHPRGAMPPGRVFIPRAIRHRNAMYRRLFAMMRATTGAQMRGHIA